MYKKTPTDEAYVCKTVILVHFKNKLMWPEQPICLLPVTLLLPVSTVLFDDFSLYLYIFTGHWQNSWSALTKPLGSAEHRFNTADMYVALDACIVA